MRVARHEQYLSFILVVEFCFSWTSTTNRLLD